MGSCRGQDAGELRVVLPPVRFPTSVFKLRRNYMRWACFDDHESWSIAIRHSCVVHAHQSLQANRLPSPCMTATASAISFQSDNTGLICGFRFEPGQPGVALDSSQIGDALERAGRDNTECADDAFIWLHFNLSRAGCMRWLQRRSTSEVGFATGHKGHGAWVTLSLPEHRQPQPQAPSHHLQLP